MLIFHAAAPDGAGPLVRALAEARRALAERQRVAFLAAGADEAEIVAGPPDGLSFGERLGAAMRARTGGAGAAGGRRGSPRAVGRTGGAIVLGSGSIPLARAADLRRFVEVAAGPAGHALANNRYSADVVAVSRAADLAELPPLPADNALPRWLEERAGVAVTDLRSRWRLGVDVDTPLDLIVLGDPAARDGAAVRDRHGTEPLIGERLAALSDVLTNRRAELLVAGRVSATTLRGWRAAWPAASGPWSRSAGSEPRRASPNRAPRPARGRLAPSWASCSTATAPSRWPAPSPRLADAAVIDTRVLLAHRHGADESATCRRPGRRPRIASPRTCCCPRPSPIRGCAP